MRARFSLRILLLLIALGLVVSSHIVLAVRHAAVQRERDELLGRLGAIQRRDDDRLHMRRMETGATYHRKWNLFIPEGKTYAVFLAVENIPATGKVMSGAHRLHEFVGEGKEITISLALLERKGTGSVEALVRTILPTQMMEASLQLYNKYLFLVVPSEANGFCEGDNGAGQESTVVEDASHLMELVRLRKISTDPAASTPTPSNPNPCDGVLLWVEEVPPKPKAPAAKSS